MSATGLNSAGNCMLTTSISCSGLSFFDHIEQNMQLIMMLIALLSLIVGVVFKYLDYKIKKERLLFDKELAERRRPEDSANSS